MKTFLHFPIQLCHLQFNSILKDYEIIAIHSKYPTQSTVKHDMPRNANNGLSSERCTHKLLVNCNTTPQVTFMGLHMLNRDVGLVRIYKSTFTVSVVR